MGPLKRLIGSSIFFYTWGRKRWREEKKGSESLPKASQSLPKTSQRLPQRLPKLPKASQSLPKGSPRVSQSLPKPPKINSEAPKASPSLCKASPKPSQSQIGPDWHLEGPADPRLASRGAHAKTEIELACRRELQKISKFLTNFSRLE